MTNSTIKKKPSFNIKKWFKVLAVFFTLLYLIIWIISSPLIKHYIKPILLEHELFLSKDSHISYNPFLSQLTVSDLTLFQEQQNASHTVLSISNLTIRLTLYELFLDKIVISKFELNDAYLEITKMQKLLLIAGFDLDSFINDHQQEKTIETQPQASNYQLLLPELVLNQVNLYINIDHKTHYFTIEKLLISQVKANQEYQQATVKLESLIDDTPLLLSANASFEQGKGEIKSQLTLAKYSLGNLHQYNNQLSEVNGSLSFSIEQSLSISSEHIELIIHKAKLNTENFLIAYQQQFFNIKKLESTVENFLVTFNQDKLSDLNGIAQLTINNADVYFETPKKRLSHIGKFTLKDINFEFSEMPQLNISSLIVDDIYGSKNKDLKLSPLVSLKQLSINNVIINKQSLAMDKVILDSLQGHVVLDKNKKVANLLSLPITSEEQKEVTEITTEIEHEINPQNAEFIISLNELFLINDNQLSFLDNSIEPAYKQNLNIDTLHFGAVSNAKDKQELETPFVIKGKSNKYAHFDFKGIIQPFAKHPSYQLQGYLKELSLPAISSYMKEAMQIELRSGQLNTNIDISLNDDQISGNLVLLFQGLETASAESEEVGILIEQGILPFNAALNMLKDSHGDVEIDVPISGLISDPQFGVGSILVLITQKAILMAAQDYLVSTFVPYANIVSVAMSVGEYAFKLRFDDLIYQQGQILPNEAQEEYLQPLIALMQNKKDTRINICAFSTPTDIDLTVAETLSDEGVIAQLTLISEQREAAFKEYMIKQGNISSSRLLLCLPKIDNNKNAKPRIEISV